MGPVVDRSTFYDRAPIGRTSVWALRRAATDGHRMRAGSLTGRGKRRCYSVGADRVVPWVASRAGAWPALGCPWYRVQCVAVGPVRRFAQEPEHGPCRRWADAHGTAQPARVDG